MISKKKIVKKKKKASRPFYQYLTPNQRTKAVRSFFAELDEKLNDMPIELKSDVAAVLSALRGPDDEAYGSKSVTTAIVRLKAFPKTGWGFGHTNYDSKDFAATRRELPQNHFTNHEKMAFQALGLKWNKNNDPNPKN